MKLPKNIKKAAVPACLCLAVLLAGIGSCRRRMFRTPRPRITMSLLDERAQPYIDEARAGVRDAVSQLCARRGRLFWLLLKSRFGKSSEAQRRIAAVLEPRVVEPLRKAAAVYGCAANPDAVSSLLTETGTDNLVRQLYASAGLAIEGVFIRATLQSLASVLQACAPRLAASWGMYGACAVSDGPLPIGDIVGLGLALGGTIWCCRDLVRAYRALPGELESALHAAIDATAAQCRMEAASSL